MWVREDKRNVVGEVVDEDGGSVGVGDGRSEVGERVSDEWRVKR